MQCQPFIRQNSLNSLADFRDGVTHNSGFYILGRYTAESFPPVAAHTTAACTVCDKAGESSGPTWTSAGRIGDHPTKKLLFVPFGASMIF